MDGGRRLDSEKGCHWQDYPPRRGRPLTALPQPATLRVQDLLAEESGLKIETMAGTSGLDRAIDSPRLQKPGLALLGANQFVHAGRVQVIGKSEMKFLDDLPVDKQQMALEGVLVRDPACLVVTWGQPIPACFETKADAAGIAVLRTELPSSVLIDRLTHYLEERLAPSVRIHGVMLELYGLGVMLEGESGIGKSESALDLVTRGHRLVADDVVELRRLGNDVLVGSCPEPLRYHMEVRGLGIINVKELYGIAATRDRKELDLVVSFERFDPDRELDRLGLKEDYRSILDVSVARIVMPVASGRSMSILVEVATRNRLLIERGLNSAVEFARRVDKAARGEQGS